MFIHNYYRRTTEAVMKEQIQTIFVATDRNPMISELSTHLQHKNVLVFCMICVNIKPFI